MEQINVYIVFWLILALFTFGAAVVMITTLANVIRLRNVRLSWNGGKLKGYPLFASFFLLTTLAVALISLYEASTAHVVVSSFYLGLGVCWFATSYFATKCYITDHGIVKNVNEPSQTVAWYQIRDFVEKEHDEGSNYIFLYRQNAEDDPYDVVRLELNVPLRKRESFRNLISHKLGRRIRCYASTGIDINVEQFER